MKKKLIGLITFAVCLMMLLTGCMTQDVSIYAPTNLSAFNFYAQYMSKNAEYIMGNSLTSSEDATTAAKIDKVLKLYKTTITEESAIMACIECFNGTSVQEGEGSRVGYYEFNEERIKVEYVNSQRTYVVEVGSGADKQTISFSVSKTDGVYTVTKKIQTGEYPCSAVVQFDQTSSSLMMQLTTKSSAGVTLKVNKEVIVLKDWDIVSRTVITEGDTNNKSIYTVECYQEVFDGKIKIAKSSSDVGKINKDTLDPETFTTATTTDLTGFEIACIVDEGRTVNAFGDISQWVA